MTSSFGRITPKPDLIRLGKDCRRSINKDALTYGASAREITFAEASHRATFRRRFTAFLAHPFSISGFKSYEGKTFPDTSGGLGRFLATRSLPQRASSHSHVNLARVRSGGAPRR